MTRIISYFNLLLGFISSGNFTCICYTIYISYLIILARNSICSGNNKAYRSLKKEYVNPAKYLLWSICK